MYGMEPSLVNICVHKTDNMVTERISCLWGKLERLDLLQYSSLGLAGVKAIFSFSERGATILSRLFWRPSLFHSGLLSMQVARFRPRCLPHRLFDSQVRSHKVYYLFFLDFNFPIFNERQTQSASLLMSLEKGSTKRFQRYPKSY